MHRDCKSQSLWLDTVLVVSSFLLAFGVVSKHEAERRVSLTLGACLLACGWGFFMKLTSLFNKCLLCTSAGIKFIKVYNLTLSDCLDITNK